VACRLLMWSQPAFARSEYGSTLSAGFASEVFGVSQRLVAVKVKTGIEAVVLQLQRITAESIEEIVMRKVTVTLVAALAAVMFTVPAFARHHRHHGNHGHHYHKGWTNGGNHTGQQSGGTGSTGTGSTGTGSTSGSTAGSTSGGTTSGGTSGFTAGGTTSGGTTSTGQ